MIYNLGPRARRVYDALREQIVEGVFPPASRLPSHTALAATFHVAPLTVRQVLSRLEDEGWVSRQQGRGTFVNQPPIPAAPAGVPGTWPQEWLEHGDDVAVVFNTDGTVRYWNPSATAHLGPPVDSGHGRRADHVYPAYMWQRWHSAAPAAPHPQDWRWQGEGRTGAALWLEGRLYPLHDQTGQLDGILCLGRDVTKYREEAQTPTPTDLVPASSYSALDLRLGLLVVGPQAVVLQCNAVVCDFLNLPFDQIQGKSLPQLLSNVIYEDGTPMSQVGGPIAQALLSGHPVHNVVLGFWQPDTADHRWLLLNADPQLGPDGVTPQVVCTAVDITQRRRILEVLEQRDRDFKTLVENAPDIITRFDPQLRHVYVNPAVTPATGLPPEAFIGKTHSEVGIPPALSAEWKEHLIRVFNTGQPIVTEFTSMTPTGPAYYQARLVPEFAPAGNIESVLSIAHDITARKQAEEALRYSEERFTKIFRTSPDTIAILRLADGCLLDVNESWLQAFGYRRDEVLGRVVPGLVLTEDATERERLVQVLHENGAVHDHEVRSHRKNGEVRQFSLSIEQIDLAGEACLLVTGRDITERQQIWLAQRRSEERLAKVFRSSPIGIAITRQTDTVIIEANNAWLTIFGYTAKEAIGQSSLALNLWADLQDREHIFTTLRQQGVVYQQELPFLQRSGEIRQGLFSVENIEIDGDSCLLWMVQDITERQQAWLAQRRSEERLAKVFRSSPIGIAITNQADGVIIEANDIWLTTFGYAWEEVIGQSSLALKLWADPRDRERMITTLRQQGIVSQQEFPFRQRSGEIRQGLFSAENIEIDGESCLLVMILDITERQQAAAALRRSEERFATAFRASPMGIGISRVSDGRIIDVNDHWVEMTGYSREEAIGQRGTTLNLWASPEDRLRIITPLAEHKALYEVETAFRRKTGTIYYASVSTEVIEIDGEPCMLMLSRDITAEKQAQDALRRSEERFSRVFQASPVGITITRQVDGRFIEVNDTWLAMMGYGREEVIGQNSTTLDIWIDPVGREEWINAIQEHGSIHLRETRYRHRSGEFRNGLSSIEPIEIDGEACLLGTIQDITERTRANQALLRSEERFAKVFRASPDAIVISRIADEQIVDVNESWTRIFGYSRDEALGQTVKALGLEVEPTDRTRLTVMIEHGAGVLDYPIMFQRRDGTRGQGSVSIEIIEIEGEPCTLAVIRDITERQQMEERARDAERLGALGRVAAGVAHEFNNVLAGIMGRLDLIMTESQDSSFNAQLRLIQQSAEDGAAVVARIGRFARTHDTSVRAPIRVQELINDVIILTEPRRRTMPDHRSPPITIRTRIAPDLLVQGNPTELREVLTNLIFNAADAMPQGGQITIIAGTENERIVIMVQDEGHGIDPAIQARIFEPFFTTKTTGSGLGLALVKNIIEAHGGEINVSSHVGRGTRFTILLPTATTMAAPAPAPVAPPLNRTARILIVDDDRRLCEMLQMMLLRGGHEVVVETSGVEAVARLDTGPFDLVCTDLGMPGMNGWEVAEQVRLHAPQARIALITGWGNQLDPADLERYQIDFVLPKPYRSAQVQDLVLQALTLGPRLAPE